MTTEEFRSLSKREQVQAIRRMRADGTTIAKIGAVAGESYYRIAMTLRAIDPDLLGHIGKVDPRLCVDMLNAGYTQKRIASAFGVSRTAIYNFKRRLQNGVAA